MPINDDQFAGIIQLIEDGELDDRMMDLQAAVDDRNGRRKEAILKLVKSVFGENAEIRMTDDELRERMGLPAAPSSTEGRPGRAPVPYVPDDGPAIPTTPDPMSHPLPTPIVSTNSSGEGFAPAADPMGGNFGDGDANFVSTGAQIG